MCLPVGYNETKIQTIASEDITIKNTVLHDHMIHVRLEHTKFDFMMSTKWSFMYKSVRHYSFLIMSTGNMTQSLVLSAISAKK